MGFGPVLGHFLALGKSAKYAIISSCIRTVVSIAFPLLIALRSVQDNGTEDDKYLAFMVSSYMNALIILPTMAIWGLVDLVLTRRIITKQVKKYENQKQKMQISVAPAMLPNGGGIMLGGRF